MQSLFLSMVSHSHVKLNVFVKLIYISFGSYTKCCIILVHKIVRVFCNCFFLNRNNRTDIYTYFMLCAENEKLFKCFHICILRAHLNKSTHVQRCKREYLDMLNPNIMCFCKKHQFLRKPHDCSYIMREAM